MSQIKVEWKEINLSQMNKWIFAAINSSCFHANVRDYETRRCIKCSRRMKIKFEMLKWKESRQITYTVGT